VSALIQADGVSAGYGAIPAIHDVNLHVDPGEIVALLGANGAGKTTTLLALSGVLSPSAGKVTFLGRATRAPLHRRARQGLGFVPGGRTVFNGLTTEENLRVSPGGVTNSLRLFPELRPLLKRRAGLLSGGEQQMVSLARTLGRMPKLVVVDELSLGLAPMIVSRLYDALREAAQQNIAVLLVEQQLHQVLKLADRAYVMRRGRIELEGSTTTLRQRIEDIEKLYLPAGN